jgi:hypothetical protein
MIVLIGREKEFPRRDPGKSLDCRKAAGLR